MDRKKNIKSINIESESNRMFFLIHGYTGSPTDFNRLPKLLYRKYNANVRIICLKGHLEHISALDDITYQQLYDQIEEDFCEYLKQGYEIVLGGVSFGSYIAFELAKKYRVRGMFNVSMIGKVGFPFNMPCLKYFGKLKKYWNKNLTDVEKFHRTGIKYYDQMHINALDMGKEGIRRLKRYAKYVTVPSLILLPSHDPLVSRNNKKILKKFHRQSTVKVIDAKLHQLFFSDRTPNVYDEIFGFIDGNDLLGNKEKDTVSAIIPSFNEAPRISNVLKTLSESDILDEIIVVDDGSIDNTEQVVNKFPKVTYYRNDTNMGKAYSMDFGVKSSNGSIIFFCDADLKNFKPEHIEDIVRPIINNEHDMFIGVRDNISQKLIKSFAINSGERAMRREVWESLPVFYKSKFRIECGLNKFVEVHGRGYDYKVLPYYQTFKESKYGFFIGTYRRWSMNFDVALAWLRFQFYDRFFHKGNEK
mgnify:CR=1 FL=1